MSRKTHLKVLGIDCRNQWQTDHEFNNQSLCGYAGVAVTTVQKEVDCRLCRRRIEDDENIDDLNNYGGGQ